jgi:hypothetical protein
LHRQTCQRGRTAPVFREPLMISSDCRWNSENIFDDRLTKIGSDGCLQTDYSKEFRAMLVCVVL